jgi:hypothetical protein
MTRWIAVLALALVGCSTADSGGECDETEDCPEIGGEVVAPYNPPAGTWSGHAVLVTQTMDNPAGSFGCAQPDARYVLPDFVFPIANGCTVTSTEQSAYKVACQYTGSGGHFTPEPNPREDRLFTLSFSSSEQKFGTCYYNVASGTMTDQDNWRDCRSHVWNVTFLQFLRCDP